MVKRALILGFLLSVGCNKSGHGANQNILLWGDSICVLGYADYVIADAPDGWTFDTPQWYEGMTVASLCERIRDLPVSAYTVFHMNAGLHEALLAGYEETPEEYEALWRNVIAYIREHNARAPIVLATTTALGPRYRPEANTLTAEYNAALVRIAEDTPNVYVDDLRAFQEGNPEIAHLPTDPIHFTQDAYAQMAIEVQMSMENALAQITTVLN